MHISEAFLLGSSALVIHLFSLTGVVSAFRILPARWLESFWQQAGYAHPHGFVWYANVVVGLLFAALATWLTTLMLTSGGPATAIAIVELLAAGAWLGFLLLGARGPRHE